MIGKRVDDPGERTAYDYADGKIEYVAAHDEFSELVEKFLETLFLLFLRCLFHIVFRSDFYAVRRHESDYRAFSQLLYHE